MNIIGNHFVTLFRRESTCLSIPGENQLLQESLGQLRLQRGLNGGREAFCCT